VVANLFEGNCKILSVLPTSTLVGQEVKMYEPVRFQCPCGSLNVLVAWQPFNPAIGSAPILLFTCRDCGRRGNAVISISGENLILGPSSWTMFRDEESLLAENLQQDT